MIRDLKFKMHCRRYSDDVYRFARSLLGNASDAEDATQEVLLRLWQHLDSIRRPDVRAWLLRTTKNYCIDQIRRRNDLVKGVSDECLESHPDHLSFDPARAANHADLRKQIDSALESLPENLRDVFVLYEVNGLRYREIADTLEVPINSVKVYLSRARAKLKQYLTLQEACLRI